MDLKFDLENPVPEIQQVKFGGALFSVLRLDTIHPEISGNKWYKLKYNLLEAKKRGCSGILTFGGAFSNHIHALAYAANKFGMKSIGMIRGELTEPINPTLKYAKSKGMEMHYVSRSQYRLKTSENYLNSLKEQFGDFYLVPEGGTNLLAVRGAAEILKGIPAFENVCVAVGTGGTLTGLISGGSEKINFHGFPVVRDGSLSGIVRDLLVQCGSQKSNWQLEQKYHFGGYAKFNDTLIDFINAFKASTGIPLDPVYTGKMMFGVINMIKEGKFGSAPNVLVIHTGGLQGISGFNKRFGNLID